MLTISRINSSATGCNSKRGNIEIERGDDVNKQFIWDEGNDHWSTVGEALARAAEFIGDLGDVTGQVSDISGEITLQMMLSEGTTNLCPQQHVSNGNSERYRSEIRSNFGNSNRRNK